MRRLVAVIALAALVVFVPSCGTVRSTIDVLRTMRSDGYHNINVRFDSSNGFDTVVVRASGGPSEDPVGRAAEIVWTTFKFKFDQIDVSVNGDRHLFSRSELQERFGPRPSGLDKDLAKDVFRTIGIVAAIGVVFVGIVVLIIVLVVRNSRRKRPPPPPGWYGGYGGPPPPPPPSHWGTPPQPQ